MKDQVALIQNYSYMQVSTHVQRRESHLAPAKPENVTEFKFGDARVYFQSFIIGGPRRETPPWKPTTQALDNLLCGTGEPRGAPEQGNGLNDFGCGQLARGLDTTLPHLCQAWSCGRIRSHRPGGGVRLCRSTVLCLHVPCLGLRRHPSTLFKPLLKHHPKPPLRRSHP